jgi:predicted PhzF superfamily epimerase YddE/YHI9
MNLRYWVVDAFTSTVFSGNPAAVVLPETALPDALMQSIAFENNLSETAFAVPQGDGWHLRWFTPTMEVDLCGHATLATAAVLARLGLAAPYRFHTRSGLLLADRHGDRLALDFPARPNRPADPQPGIEAALGAAPIALVQSADLIAIMDSPETVARLRPDFGMLADIAAGRLIVTAAGGAHADVTSRFFAPGLGIDEDPVTGSLHTQVVPYWSAIMGRSSLLCHQASRRGGMLWCDMRGERVIMAGHSVLYAAGELVFPRAEGGAR